MIKHMVYIYIYMYMMFSTYASIYIYRERESVCVCTIQYIIIIIKYVMWLPGSSGPGGQWIDDRTVADCQLRSCHLRTLGITGITGS